MKQVKIGFILLLLSSFLGSLPAYGQWMSKVKYRNIGYLMVGGQINASNYFGDLNPLAQYVSTDITSTRPSFGIQVTRKFSPRLQGRLSLTWNRLLGDDFKAADPTDERHRYRFIRNAHFRNDVLEMALMFTFDLIPSRYVYHKRVKYTPYLLAGIAGMYHNPRAKTPEAFGNNWVNLRDLRTEGQGLVRSSDGSNYDAMYSLFQPAIPLGIGVRFKLNDRTDLSFEVAYRYLFTDYLDDVGGDYANPADLESDLARAMADRTMEGVAARRLEDRTADRNRLLEELGYPANGPFAGFGNEGDKRGETGNNDVYIVTGFHLNYIVNVGLKCPKFR